MFVCLYVSLCVHVRMCVCAFVCLWAAVFVSIDQLIVCVRVYLCVCVFVCLYVSLCLSMCVYVCVRACSLCDYLLVDTHFSQVGLSCEWSILEVNVEYTRGQRGVY